VIDAHVHVACADERRYPRRPTGAGSDWWREGGDAAALVEALDASGVEQAVVVQAVGVYAYDCECAIDTVTRDRDRFALVGAVDMDGDDPAEALADLAAKAPLAGVRTFAVGDAGSAWLADGRGDAVWALAAELDLVVVPTIFTERLPELRVLLERHPNVTVALDHCAFPDMAPPGRRSDLRHLAELRGLHLKVTSHNLDGPDDPAAFLEPLLSAFGPERLTWGSDHPQHQSLTYPEMVALAWRACRNLAPHERAAFLEGTARRLWFGGMPPGVTPSSTEPGAGAP
jgi:predicted TIM-barrel fold metal-dependent hydrolase